MKNKRQMLETIRAMHSYTKWMLEYANRKDKFQFMLVEFSGLKELIKKLESEIQK